VNLRAFGQKDPLIEYKNDGYAMFVELMDSIKNEVLNNLFRSTTNLQAFEKLLGSLPQNLVQQMMSGDIMLGGTAADQMAEEEASEEEAEIVPKPKLEFRREVPKAGRNEPCPCGSGKKFKNCCGRTA
jgi:preprotein translocase subunit SecA